MEHKYTTHMKIVIQQLNEQEQKWTKHTEIFEPTIMWWTWVTQDIRWNSNNSYYSE